MMGSNSGIRRPGRGKFSMAGQLLALLLGLGLFTGEALADSDVSITMSVDNTTPREGDIITITCLAENLGPSRIVNIIHRTLPWPAGLTHISGSATEGGWNVAAKQWDWLHLDTVGESHTLTILARVNPGTAGTTITPTIYFQQASDPNTNSANNQDSVDINVQLADLQLTKVVSNSLPLENRNVDYTVTVTNTGPTDASGVEVTDLLPAGVSYVSDTPSQGSYVNSTGIWSVGNIANGSTATLFVRANVDPFTRGSTITNSASLTDGAQGDPNPGDNADSVDIVVKQTDLVLSHVVDKIGRASCRERV